MDKSLAIDKLFKALGILKDQYNITKTADRLLINLAVPETDSGILIGHHGETIDALQTLVALIYNQNLSDYQPVMVDINSYRANRLLYLEELSSKAAAQALESGREIILPPLSSFERRHIHMFLKENTGVDTYSEGEGLSRRLIIRPIK